MKFIFVFLALNQKKRLRGSAFEKILDAEVVFAQSLLKPLDVLGFKNLNILYFFTILGHFCQLFIIINEMVFTFYFYHV